MKFPQSPSNTVTFSPLLEMASQQCANCGKGATTKCTGCMDAPEYHPRDSIDTVYCNRDYQAEHWAYHKNRCRTMEKRKTLLRAGRILKAALLTYREVVYDIDLEKFEFADGALWLHLNDTVTGKPRPQTFNEVVTDRPRPFPGHLTTNIAFKEAALAKWRSTMAVWSLLARLARILIEGGVAAKIEVHDIQVEKAPIPTKLCPGKDDRDRIHQVLEVTPRGSNELWILDPAGCQYGFRHVLVPHAKYLRTAYKPFHFCVNIPIHGVAETRDLDTWLEPPHIRNKESEWKTNMELERQARVHFASFVKTLKPPFVKDILGCSAAEFEEKLGRFAQDLKLHMLELDVDVCGGA